MEQLLEGTVRPIWNEINSTIDNCSDRLKKRCYNNDTVDVLIMILEGLLENAIKYGVFQRNEDSITYSIIKTGDTIIVETRNRILDENKNNIKKLDELIQWIRGYQNPLEAYISRLNDSASLPLINEESGLGLVRMAYEGQAILDFYIDSNNIIAVSALYHLTSEVRS